MKVVSLINMKGGVGKTTMAVNIADCLYTKDRHKVLLIDIDPQFNATQCLMSSEVYVDYIKIGKPTIVNIFDRNSRTEVGVVEGTAVEKPVELESIVPHVTERGFDLLPGALELFRLEMGAGGGREFRLKRYLDKLSGYDYVIIDTPPTPSVWMTSALIASDYYLIPVKPDPISLTGIDLLQSIITEKKEEYSLKINCCGVVFTMVEKDTKVYRNARRYLSQNRLWEKKLYENFVHKRTSIAYSQMNQKFILDSEDSTLKLDLVRIVDEFLERILV